MWCALCARYADDGGADLESIFVSYAWGDTLEKKEWLRDQVITCIKHPDFSIFWDRDSIPYGRQTIDETINQALAARPIVVLCICDTDYCQAASETGSGLWKELNLMEEIIGKEEVRIIPIILQEECKLKLPSLLQGLPYLDLSELHHKKLFLGQAVLSLVLGETQAKIISQIATQIRLAELREKANKHFQFNTLVFYGNARTHEVLNSSGQMLLPQKWMIERSNYWTYRLSEDSIYFSPQKGIWYWREGEPSLTVHALGTAVCAAFFQEKTNDADIRALEHCGKILAEKEFSYIKESDFFELDATRLIKMLLSDPEGEASVTQLLS